MTQERLPVLAHQLLYLPEGAAQEHTPIEVGSLRWYAWLADEAHRSFSLRHALGTFTARREHVRQGWYWYVYHKAGGKLRKAYLGKAEEITLQRLERVVATLINQPEIGPPGDVPPSGEHLDRGSRLVPVISSRPPNAGSAAVRTDALPAPLTPLLGRQEEVATACALLRRTEVRLLVVTGPGGIGKTRLALRIATDLREDFPAGVCFVALDALRDPALVAPTILHTLGLHESASESVIEQLKGSLREQRLLLLLDNFEQVASAAPLLTDLLMACPRLKLLVTSRARLRVRGEQTLVVPPLAFPDLEHLASQDTLVQYASVALFLQHARALQPTFQVNQTNARAIAAICARLEGMPLAIELAAARITHLSPEALLARLSQRLEVLTSGPQDAPVRQQTLRNTLAWSYSLLSPAEQRLFRHLAIFARGCTLEAAEAICNASGDERGEAIAGVFEGMAALIDNNLLYQAEQDRAEPRFELLETTREYGHELLANGEELEAARQRYARYYLALAERAAQAWEGPAFALWLGRIERDHENLRAAMQWALEGGTDPEHLEVALRLGSALRNFWQVRGYFREGRGLLEQVLAHSEGSHARLRAKVLNEAVHLAISQGDFAWGEALCQENLARCRELGDSSAIARAHYLLGLCAFYRGDLMQASTLQEECLALSQAVGDQVGTVMALIGVGLVAFYLGEYSRVQEVGERSLDIQRKLANKRGIGWSLFMLAELRFYAQQDATTADAFAREAGALFQELDDKWGMAECSWLQGHIALEHAQFTTAGPLLKQSVALFRGIGTRRGAAHALCLLGRLAAAEKDWSSARALCEEGLAEAQAVHNPVETVFALEGLAGVVAAERASLAMLLWAAQLWGAAEALRETIKAPLPPVDRPGYERDVAVARSALGKRLFAASWAAGRTMTPAEAQAAQGQEHAASPPVSRTAGDQAILSMGLTTREVEVLRWVARGLTDAQVASRLVISPRTVSSHLTSIYQKLGVSSRSAATRFAVAHQLV